MQRLSLTVMVMRTLSYLSGSRASKSSTLLYHSARTTCQAEYAFRKLLRLCIWATGALAWAHQGYTEGSPSESTSSASSFQASGFVQVYFLAGDILLNETACARGGACVEVSEEELYRHQPL